MYEPLNYIRKSVWDNNCDRQPEPELSRLLCCYWGDAPHYPDEYDGVGIDIWNRHIRKTPDTGFARTGEEVLHRKFQKVREDTKYNRNRPDFSLDIRQWAKKHYNLDIDNIVIYIDTDAIKRWRARGAEATAGDSISGEADKESVEVPEDGHIMSDKELCMTSGCTITDTPIHYAATDGRGNGIVEAECREPVRMQSSEAATATAQAPCEAAVPGRPIGLIGPISPISPISRQRTRAP